MGSHFVAGTDISQFVDFTTGADGVAYEKRLDAIVARLDALELVTIAAVQGYAVGGGLAHRHGVRPAPLHPGRAVRRADRAHGGELPLDGELRPARRAPRRGAHEADGAHRGVHDRRTEAWRIGFVLPLVDPRAFETRLGALCARLAGHAPITMQVTREAIRRIVAQADAEGDDLVRARLRAATTSTKGSRPSSRNARRTWKGE